MSLKNTRANGFELERLIGTTEGFFLARTTEPYNDHIPPCNRKLNCYLER